MATDEERVRIASSFLLDSPPGEINDVFNDVRVLLDDDALLQRNVQSVFAQYNKEQLTVVQVPGQSHKSVIAQEGEVDGGRFLDPRSKQVFVFDHIRQEASDPEPYTETTETEAQRAALEEAGLKYLEEHYPAGVISVFDDGQASTVAIVDNKYNPNNFWNGRWRSIWKVTPGSSEVTGTVKVNVHYYEDGNVQLNATKDITVTVPTSQDNPTAHATSVYKQIAKAEGEFQTALNESYAQLSETTFKSLRRALPVTRNKIDWHAISTYKIGAELQTK
ncbi:F-actin-capping protein [Rhizophlyctis rosea]|uniref:F-actin-capping protein subunit alpha n=1 Tax=Rhizophlyctis rosea TaxID=64517 RepID=A0AAD5S7V4_9FUNG|nr:F-actin-capping protein [Rhizophlyctis rosea]